MECRSTTLTLQAVNLGDDADTTGAVYGQLADAYYGLSGIPEPWQARVSKADLILQLADQLLTSAGLHKLPVPPRPPLPGPTSQPT